MFVLYELYKERIAVLLLRLVLLVQEEARRTDETYSFHVFAMNTSDCVHGIDSALVGAQSSAETVSKSESEIDSILTTSTKCKGAAINDNEPASPASKNFIVLLITRLQFYS